MPITRKALLRRIKEDKRLWAAFKKQFPEAAKVAVLRFPTSDAGVKP